MIKVTVLYSGDFIDGNIETQYFGTPFDVWAYAAHLNVVNPPKSITARSYNVTLAKWRLGVRII